MGAFYYIGTPSTERQALKSVLTTADFESYGDHQAKPKFATVNFTDPKIMRAKATNNDRHFPVNFRRIVAQKDRKTPSISHRRIQGNTWSPLAMLIASQYSRRQSRAKTKPIRRHLALCWSFEIQGTGMSHEHEAKILTPCRGEAKQEVWATTKRSIKSQATKGQNRQRNHKFRLREELVHRKSSSKRCTRSSRTERSRPESI